MKLFIIVIMILNSILKFSSTAYVESTYKSYKNYKLIEVTGDSNALTDLLHVLKNYDNSLVYAGDTKDTLLVLLAPDLLQKFQHKAANEKLTAKVIFEDYSEIIREEREPSLQTKGFSWSAYHDVDVIYDYLRNVSESYPDLTKLIVGGESYEGRQILGIQIDTPEQRSENGKPVILIESGIHAREWITPATTTYFINELLTSKDERIIALRNQFDWRIFPTVNPDGYHYTFTNDRMWRKTRSVSSNGCFGADPNRNWDYNWLQHGASNNPCDYQTFGGDHPFSEKETRTLSAYIASIDNLLGYIAFHSDAQMLLVPYSDSTEHTDNYDDLMLIGNTSIHYGNKVNGAKYKGPATAAEILYKASGGSMDWVRKALGTDLVYTYELRGFYFHWPPALIYLQGDEVTQMMLGLITEARKLGYFIK